MLCILTCPSPVQFALTRAVEKKEASKINQQEESDI